MAKQGCRNDRTGWVSGAFCDNPEADNHVTLARSQPRLPILGLHYFFIVIWQCIFASTNNSCAASEHELRDEFSSTQRTRHWIEKCSVQRNVTINRTARLRMYNSILLPWSTSPSQPEALYRAACLVRTQGTVFILPPGRDALIQAFEAPPRPKTRCSSGAVALCKHFERGGASSEHGKAHPYWPLPIGSNDNKSRLATETLNKMLDDLAWRNVMLLHPGVAVYEIRNSRGYGMRWTLELENEIGSLRAQKVQDQTLIQSSNLASTVAELEPTIKEIYFRGFLEPIIGMGSELPGQNNKG